MQVRVSKVAGLSERAPDASFADLVERLVEERALTLEVVLWSNGLYTATARFTRSCSAPRGRGLTALEALHALQHVWATKVPDVGLLPFGEWDVLS